MLRRTGFKRPQVQRQRSYPSAAPAGLAARVSIGRADASAASVPKEIKARKGKCKPTKAEAEWMKAITELGCIACLVDGREHVPGAVHHILRGGHRIGHLHTICLCDPGHHQNGQAMGVISRHPWKAQFEARYGTEAHLLDMTKRLVLEGAHQ